MPRRPASILADPAVREALAEAWVESVPGSLGGHEEGGFVLLASDGRLIVSRWPMGEQDTIRVPAHTGCKLGSREIVASFHTHPNLGPDYLQEPGETDKRGVRDDADLKGSEYVGEFVIANELIYLVTPMGMVREIGERTHLLGAQTG
jgi:hypothetical protein